MELIEIDSNKSEEPRESVQRSTVSFKIKNNDVEIWLVDPTYTQQQISSESMPAPIGSIATFTEHNLKLKNPIRIFKYPEVLAKSLDEGIPQIIGFSNYMWNFELSLSFARRIKEFSPKTIVVMGGPNYPFSKDEQIKFLHSYPEIDFYVEGEGEVAFANLVAALINSDMNKNSLNKSLPSVHYIIDGEAHIAETVERIHDLTEVPSPYSTGKLDEFFDGKLQPIIQTTRGCPFACTFCVEGTNYYTKVYRSTQEKTINELNYIGKKMVDVRKRGGRNDLWIADSNFGMYDNDIETCKAIAECQTKYNWPEYIQVDTGKNNKAKVLSAAKLVNGAIRLSGSVQTLTPEVLVNIKRSNISADQLMSLAMEAAEIDADSRSEIILALPGETKQSHFQTIKTVIEAGFNHINTYQLMMLPGTEVNDKDCREKNEMKMRYRILPRCFGDFDVLRKPMLSAEIEEICVATNTLSFDDYVDCRKMHLIIHLFHNDGIFNSVLKLIRTLGISVYRWLELIYEERLEGVVKELFDAFEKETRVELWANKDELKQHIQKEGTVQDYIDGKLGYNLLFVYKALALTKYLHELMELANKTLQKLLKENNLNDSDHLAFMEDVLKFDFCRVDNLFTNMESEPTTSMNFNLQAFLEDKEKKIIKNYKLEKPEILRFVLNDEQKDVIKRSLRLYGTNNIGISRMLSKVFVKKLLRQPLNNSKFQSIKVVS